MLTFEEFTQRAYKILRTIIETPLKVEKFLKTVLKNKAIKFLRSENEIKPPKRGCRCG